MTDNIHDLLIANSYETDGEKRTRYTNVGVAFENEKAGYSLVIHDGLSLSGRVLMLPRKDREQPQGGDDQA